MIQELRIEDLGVISAAVCPFHRGFTAVTGETGAGKTMVVSGLGMLTGGRADPGLIRSGRPQASVEGWFDLAADDPVAAEVRAAGGTVDEDGLTAARIIAARGRSFLGGRGVPSSVLSGVVGRLLVIHGQHDQVHVGSRAGALLDSFAGPRALQLAAAFADGHATLRALEAELAQLREGVRARAREIDTLTHALEQISAVDPQPGEDVALAAEAERLAHAEALSWAARTARDAISAEAEGEGADVISALAAARRALEGESGHDPVLAEHAAAIRSAMIQLAEVAADLSAYVEDVEADPRRLAAVQDRIADLARLTRMYGEDVEAVLAWAAGAASRLAQLAGADDRIEGLAEQRATVRAQLGALAAELHDVRVEAAQRFATEVSGELAALAMPRAWVGFEVMARPDADGLDVPGLGVVAYRPGGVDEVTLVLAANPGAPARPISHAASGGELSRVMLAIQVVLAGADPVPTMVFDEVDAGVGGAAAIEVGRRLQRLSERTQVIVVTHLPQVAAFADRQLVVTKGSDGSVTASSVREVSGDERVRELSRMLAGLAESAAAGEHARELLDMARRDAGAASSGVPPQAR